MHKSIVIILLLLFSVNNAFTQDKRRGISDGKKTFNSKSKEKNKKNLKGSFSTKGKKKKQNDYFSSKSRTKKSNNSYDNFSEKKRNGKTVTNDAFRQSSKRKYK